MIEEKKLIEDIWKRSNNHTTEWSTGGIIALIEKQPKTDCSECSRRKFYQQGYQDGLNADKWIPCEVEMPKELGRYIVTLKDGRSLEAIYDNISKRFIMYEHEVIAWQPLPKPYKAGDTNVST